MSLLIKNCAILTPCEGGGIRYLECGYIGITGDTIDYVGETMPEKTYADVKDMSGKLLIPGLINTHTHTAMCLLRGVGSDLSLQEWLFDTVFPIEDRLTADDIRAGTQLAILEMIASGTTSFSDMYMEPAVAVEEVIKAGMKANICRPVQCFDPTEPVEENFRVKESLDLFRKYNGAGDGRVLIDFAVHAEYTCTEDVTRYYADLCREHGGNLHVHLSETKKEHNECIDKYGKTPAKWFSDLGAFDSGAFCAHSVWVTEEDMALMRDKGVCVVHNPTSNMKLGSGLAPVQKMLDMGITVGLGTDGAASNNNLNMLEEMHLASVIHNGYSGDPTIMKPADILRMATLNGAKIQRRDDTGTLEPGKKADIVAIDLSAPHLFPNLDAAALVCYSAQASDVCMTMVNGNVLYENGEFLTLDKDEILRNAAAAVKRLYA